MQSMRHRLQFQHQEYIQKNKKDKYLPMRDLKSCEEISMKIDDALKSGKNDFGGSMYSNFDCIEFKILKQKYQKDEIFNILPFPDYPNVSKMRIRYNNESYKLDINII